MKTDQTQLECGEKKNAPQKKCTKIKNRNFNENYANICDANIFLPPPPRSVVVRGQYSQKNKNINKNEPWNACWVLCIGIQQKDCGPGCGPRKTAGSGRRGPDSGGAARWGDSAGGPRRWAAPARTAPAPSAAALAAGGRLGQSTPIGSTVGVKLDCIPREKGRNPAANH